MKESTTIEFNQLAQFVYIPKPSHSLELYVLSTHIVILATALLAVSSNDRGAEQYQEMLRYTMFRASRC